MMTLLIVFVVVTTVLLMLAGSVYTVKDNERLAIFRSGRFFRIGGPGFVFVIPIVEKKIRVHLKDHVPGWEEMSKAKLDERIKQFVLSGKK
jgi:regulator of protease activity HflC (stomatin/prohibitin superfamily)